MKGPSLERQYNNIQEQIKKKIDNYNSKRYDHNFLDLKEKDLIFLPYGQLSMMIPKDEFSITGRLL